MSAAWAIESLPLGDSSALDKLFSVLKTSQQFFPDIRYFPAEWQRVFPRLL